MERKKIPFSDNFYIDIDANVYDALGNKRNTSVNGDGYITVNVKTSDGRWITFGVHRLMALTYLPVEDVNRNQVNHRDIDLKNNSLANLEWVTVLENNIHAEIMRNNGSHISVYSVKDNVVMKGYRNAHEAALDNSCSALDVWDSVKNNLAVNGVTYCFRRYSVPLPVALQHNRRTNFTAGNRPTSIPIKMMDIYTGEVTTFDSIGKAARHFNTHPSHVFQAISKTPYPRVFRKQYQVVYGGDDFPVMSLEELERAKTHGAKEVLAYEVDSRKLLIFESAVKFIEHTGLSKKAVTVTLKSNKIRNINGWVALYNNADNQLLLKSYISSPVET